MNTLYFPFVLTVGGMLFYHLSQKSIPKEINPFMATIIAYVAGIVVCAVFAFTYPGNRSLTSALRVSNWAVFTVGAAAAFIEVGFMLSYRTGWRISVAAIATNAALAALLIPIGIVIFKEHLSLRNVLGLAFCVVGLILAARN